MGVFRTVPSLREAYAKWWEKEIPDINADRCVPHVIYKEDEYCPELFPSVNKSYDGCCFEAKYTFRGQTMIGKFGILEDDNLCLISISRVNSSEANFGNYSDEEESPYEEILLPSEAFGRKITEIGGGADYSGFKNSDDGIVSTMTKYSRIVIPEGVRVIHEGAFCDQYHISDGYSISIPSTVEKISEHAFRCSGTITVEIIPENEYFTVINDILYDKKNKRLIQNLKGTGLSDEDRYSIEVPEGIRIIDSWAFRESTGMKAITLPSTLREIPEKFCYVQVDLEKVVIKEGTEVIHQYAFSYCGLRDVTIPSSVSKIEDGVFDCKDTSKVTFHVNRHSYAAEYAIKLGGKRVYPDDMDWLNA